MSLSFSLTEESINSLHSLKNAGPTRQEHARLEVENAEDDLVQKTEVAIQLMKAVLDNVQTVFFFSLWDAVADVG